MTPEEIPSYPEPKVIAEIGCNHRGEFETALEMINVASIFCKVHAVKFQKRRPRESLSNAQYNAPHPNPMHSYGDTYGAHREYLEFSAEQHRQLKAACEERGLVYSTSVWDLTSAREIIALEPHFIKVPSACNTFDELISVLCREYRGDLHISLGMTTRAEEEALVSKLAQEGRLKDVVLYACTSGYPVAFEDVCLLEITRLREAYGADAKAIGFSGHHLGFAIDTAAYTLGAEWVERHFTMDRTWKGTDHAASLEPDGMRRLARNLQATRLSLSPKRADVLPVEAVQRAKLKRRIAG